MVREIEVYRLRGANEDGEVILGRQCGVGIEVGLGLWRGCQGRKVTYLACDHAITAM